MTTTDPNISYDPITGDETVLEPGDEGYVDPQSGAMAPAPHEEGGVLEVDLQEVAGTPPQDLSLVNEPGQDASEAIVMNRGMVVDSLNPADIVPNTPQIRMGPQEPEVVVEDEEEEIVEDEAAGRATAADLIAQARAATTDAELDKIEAQADNRVTVLDAVEKRRAEL